MVGRERNPHICEADLVTEESEEVGQFAIEGQSHGSHLRRIRPHLMPKNIVRRKADGEQVGRLSCAQIFVNHQFLREFQLILVRKGR